MPHRATSRFITDSSERTFDSMEPSTKSGKRTPFILGATSILCSYCHDILDSWELILGDSNQAFAHHQSIAELENAAVSECSMCYQFLRSRWLESRSSLISDTHYRGVGVRARADRRRNMPALTTYRLKLTFQYWDPRNPQITSLETHRNVVFVVEFVLQLHTGQSARFTDTMPSC
jgi:hypothetical protein